MKIHHSGGIHAAEEYYALGDGEKNTAFPPEKRDDGNDLFIR